ncbi:lambda-crystallin homolog isoform X1 [Pollicipes pollicipes]|uniref:lambda-crystallin homolog isoform X1 n=2 Tax=Pollicipes pollicipes TaxID=41117 RepID=UPI0018858220|nr:lambda-crystallin homolog isoform X1 [Pollicipes pollicipes]
MTGNGKKVGIVGSGLIGRSWAMLFAGAGYQVSLFDAVDSQIPGALDDIRSQLDQMERHGMLRGDLTADQQLQLITGAKDLAECVSGAVHVQECVPERLELKQQVFEQLDRLTDGSTVLSSSTSCLGSSKFTQTLQHRSSCLVAHPVNPPFYVPLVELVPAPWTDPEVVRRTRELMLEIGQDPVTLGKEMPGFALNRIQYAILNECWRLIADGVLDVQDVDSLMKSGLGPRYAFMGPLETAHLNAEGMANYCDRYSKTVFSVSETFGPVPRMEGKLAEEVDTQMTRIVPLEKLQERRAWRDARLAALARLKKDMDSGK